MREEYAADSAIVAWWGTEIECASALSRREREGRLSGDRVAEALARLDALRSAWEEVEPSDVLRRTARRMVRTHPLRSGDALQLAAALAAAEGDPSSLELVTLDERLAEAARREGFRVGPQQQV